MPGLYKTPGRQRLIEYVSTHPDRYYTADELDAALNDVCLQATSDGQTPPARIPKSSLYRHLSELCADGSLKKTRADSRSAYVYQYVPSPDCARHFHLQCVDCGQVVHLHCTVSDDLLSHLLSEHHFKVDSGRSVLYGVCEECTKKREFERSENDGQDISVCR